MGQVLRVVVAAVIALAAAGPIASGVTAAAIPVSSDRGFPPGSSTLVIAPAAVDDFAFQSMDVQYTLDRAPDGTSTLRVVETFVALFPEADQNRGMRRVIPDTYQEQPLFPQLESVTDQNGEPRASETESEDGEYRMTSAADDFVHGAQTYVFTYTLHNVTWTFEDTGGDEFYWDVNGVDWPQPFGRVSATLTVESELAAALTGQQACYRGAEGSTDTCEIGVATTGTSTTIAAEVQDLAPFETMTIAVGFEQGTFTLFNPGYFASPWGWAQALGVLGAAGGVALALIQLRRGLRDEPGRGVIIPEYSPPDRIDALQSAVLLGRSGRAVPAEVLEQAVAGSIRILEGKSKLFGGVRLEAELVDPSRADGDGRMLLAGLFGADAPPGEVFEFGRSDTRFSSAAQKMLRWANNELVANGLRRKVGWAPRGVPLLVAIVTTALVVLFGAIALNAGVVAWAPIAAIAAALGSLVVVIMIVSRKPLTAAGSSTREHLLGLKIFIEWAEADRIRMLQSPDGAQRARVDVDDPRQMLKLYETLLPYAVVFGQEKEWAERIVVLYGAATPYWYIGASGFDASSFSHGIGSLSASTSSASATSGGSGGGGSAGGGGGGGGGGGV